MSRIFNRVLDGLAFFGGALCILMVLGVSADVVGRYFLKQPIMGMVEANQVMILWIVFLAAAWVLRTRGHINMDIVLLRLSKRGQAWLEIVTSALSAIMSFILSWYSVEVIVDLFRRNTIETGNIAINSGWIILAIPVGCIPLGIEFLRKALEHGKALRPRSETDVPSLDLSRKEGK